MKPAVLAKHVAELALTKKAHDVVLMNLKGLSSVTDFFVVCSADSDIQVKAIASAVEDGLKLKGERPYQVERGSPNWVVLDYVDVVLHVFHKQTRPFYNLEKLWGDAKISRVEDAPAEAPRPKVKKAPAVKAKPKVKPKGKTKSRTTGTTGRTATGAKPRTPRRKVAS